MITIAVPTRHRGSRLDRFLATLKNTAPGLNFNILVLIDCPDRADDTTFTVLEQWSSHLPNLQWQKLNNKSSLPQLWNECIIRSATDWVLVCNDDAEFKPGWYEYLTNKIAEGKHLQINLLHYGGFCIHKRMIVKNGWFDEFFTGGGFEDNDWQLRLFEAGLKPLVDTSHDCVFMTHKKYDDKTDWNGGNNGTWICEKWQNPQNWRLPSFRKYPEVNWHPRQMLDYELKYGEKGMFPLPEAIKTDRAVYH
jgi:hypothetical protein